MTFLEVAQELAETRRAWATEFLLQRTNFRTDLQARAAADELYVERLTLLEARYEVGKHLLGYIDPESLTKFLEGEDATPADTDTDQEPTEASSDTEGEGPDCGD